jgi:hypothetical protein
MGKLSGFHGYYFSWIPLKLKLLATPLRLLFLPPRPIHRPLHRLATWHFFQDQFFAIIFFRFSLPPVTNNKDKEVRI